MTATVLDGSYAAGVDAAGHTGGPEEFADLLVQTCRHARSTAIHLGVLDLDDAPTTARLVAVARCRRTELYGFRLGARLVGTVTGAGAALLRSAGVNRVELVGEPPESDSGPEAALLAGVAAVVPLHEQDLEVVWRLSAGFGDPVEEVAAAALMPLLHHLPPPVAPDPEQGVVADATARWRQAHVPRTLTYGRGPGFVRIFDRREPDSFVTFVTLDGLQAQVFLAADRAVPAAALAGRAPNVPAEVVTRFLDRLVERRLMCRTASGRYQRLPIRRRMEERWVEGDA